MCLVKLWYIIAIYLIQKSGMFLYTNIKLSETVIKKISSFIIASLTKYPRIKSNQGSIRTVHWKQQDTD